MEIQWKFNGNSAERISIEFQSNVSGANNMWQMTKSKSTEVTV